MALTPGYGGTPVTDDEREALVPAIRDVLGEPITKAAVYDLEQAIQADVAEDLITQVIERELPPAFFLTDSFLRVLHRRLYGVSHIPLYQAMGLACRARPEST